MMLDSETKIKYNPLYNKCAKVKYEKIFLQKYIITLLGYLTIKNYICI